MRGRTQSTAIPFNSLRRFALSATADKQGFVRIVAAFTDDEKERLFNRAEQALKNSRSVKNRRLLRALLRVIEPLLPNAKEREAQRRLKDLEGLEAHRRKMAYLDPWVLDIVGRTEVATFVTAQMNVRWAPKRKRRR